MWQQVAVYLVFAIAAIYLARYIYDGVRAIVRSKGGCGEGCDKCAFAGKSVVTPRKRGGAALDVIPLTDARTLKSRSGPSDSPPSAVRSDPK